MRKQYQDLLMEHLGRQAEELGLSGSGGWARECLEKSGLEHAVICNYMHAVICINMYFIIRNNKHAIICNNMHTILSNNMHTVVPNQEQSGCGLPDARTRPCPH